MSEREVKQIIVIRKDLKMRRGKEIAQGSHASISFAMDIIRNRKDLTPEQKLWVEGRFTKICLVVNSEEELLTIYNRALEANLTAVLITDSGLTEFDGVPTNTCIAIGPNYSDDINKITSELKLY